MTQLAVCIAGGVITRIYSNNPSVCVDVVDLDDLDDMPLEEREAAIERLTKKLPHEIDY